MRKARHSLLNSILLVIDLTKSPDSTFTKLKEINFSNYDIHIFYIGEDSGRHPAWQDWSIPSLREIHNGHHMVKDEKDEDRMCKNFLGHGHVTIWNGTLKGRIGDMVIQILCTTNFDTVVIPSYLKRQDEYFKNNMVPIFGTSPIPLMTI